MLDGLDAFGDIEVLGALDVLGGLSMRFLSSSISVGELGGVPMVRLTSINGGLVDLDQGFLGIYGAKVTFFLVREDGVVDGRLE